LALLVVGLGFAGVYGYARAGVGAAPLSTSLARGLIALVTALFFAGAAGLAGTRGRTLLGRVVSGFERVWPAAIPLAALLVVERYPKLPLAAAAAFGAVVVFHLRTASPPAWRLARRPPSAAPARLGPWELALLGFALAVCVLYLAVAALADGNEANDGAYYFGVARHIARTGRFEEPIVWQFVKPPATLIHWPFDYWGGLTSIVLVPPLAVFGATVKTAMVTMGVISCAALLAFWYLVCVAIPLRSPAAQLVGLVSFALSPALASMRFDTETIALYHLLLLASLAAFAKGRLIWSAVLAFGLVLTRGDGSVVFGLVSLAALVTAAGARRGRRAAMLRIALAGLGLVVAYVAYHWIVFRSATPPGAAVAPLLPDGSRDLHAYPVPLSKGRLLSFLTWEYLSERTKLAVTNLRDIRFLAARQDVWFGLAGLAVLSWFRRRTAFLGLVSLLVLPAPFAVAYLSRGVFSVWRTLYPFAPVIVLAGAMGLDLVLSRIARIRFTGRAARVQALALAVGSFLATYPFLSAATLYGPRWSGHQRKVELAMRTLDPLLGGEPAATDLPWYLVANTSSPAVMVPENGERAIGAILRRYRIRWLVLAKYPWMRGSLGPLTKLERDGALTIEGLRIERASNAGAVRVYRITDLEGGSSRPALPPHR
jgi:hypothetical protein